MSMWILAIGVAIILWMTTEQHKRIAEFPQPRCVEHCAPAKPSGNQTCYLCP